MKTRPSCRGVFVCACVCMISDEQTVMSLVNARHSTCSLLNSVYNDHYCFTAIIMMTTETSLVLPLRRLSLSVNDPLIQNLVGLLVLWTEEVCNTWRMLSVSVSVYLICSCSRGGALYKSILCFLVKILLNTRKS